MAISLAIRENPTVDYFREVIQKAHQPAILRGMDIGPCQTLWTTDYLCSSVGNRDVKIHVSQDPQMDFLKKNFAYKSLPFAELIQRCAQTTQTNYFLSPTEFYYLRSLGNDSRGRDVADFSLHYPTLASDLKIPSFFDPERFFSSVFRASSAHVQLWTHYDIMDNVLIQVRGRKRVVLFSPADSLNLYLEGDKSLVIDIDNPDLERFPKFAQVQRFEGVLEPGDILYIPALWFHNVIALEPSIAVNVFWKNLDPDLYDKKDPYGNKDVLPAAKALQMVESALKQLKTLPEEYQDFYKKRMLLTLQKSMDIGK